VLNVTHLFGVMKVSNLFKKTKGQKCAVCKGSGFRWGWWTLIITIPLQVLLDGLSQLLPFVILLLLFLCGLTYYTQTFTALFYALCLVVGVPLVWYGCKFIFPICSVCSGRGRVGNDV